MRSSWKPEISLTTLDRWKSRIATLTSESMPGVLLQKYCKLQSEIEPFEKMIKQRCAVFDHHVESLIERKQLPD